MNKSRLEYVFVEMLSVVFQRSVYNASTLRRYVNAIQYHSWSISSNSEGDFSLATSGTLSQDHVCLLRVVVSDIRVNRCPGDVQ